MTVGTPSLNRRTLIQKFVRASVGATFIQIFGIGQSPKSISALAQTSRSQGINRFNINYRLGYELWSPILQGIGDCVGTFFRQTGEGVGGGVKTVITKTSEAGGNIIEAIGDGLSTRIRDWLSGAERKRQLQEIALEKDFNRKRELITLLSNSTEKDFSRKRELITLLRDSMLELQANEIELKLTEIQSSWDLQNWNGILSRQETEDLLKAEKGKFLVLLSPPKISPDTPDSIRNNLEIDLQSLATFFTRYFSNNGQYPVTFYSGYFKRPVNDINIVQLHKILSPIPTAILYMDMTDYECTFHVGFWGINSDQISYASTSTWNWEETNQEFISEIQNEKEALRAIRKLIVTGQKLFAGYVADLYYLTVDPYYQPRLPKLKTEFIKDGFSQTLLDDYPNKLNSIQQQELQNYEFFLEGIRENEIIKLNAQKWRLTNTLSGHTSYVNSVAISPDGEILASGSSDKTIKFWNLKTGDLIGTYEENSNTKVVVAFTPDGQTLVSNGSDKTINIWNLSNLKKGSLTYYSLTGHSDTIWSLAISPDGQTLASGSSDKTIKLWNIQTRQLIRTLAGNDLDVYGVAFSPDGQILANCGRDGNIKLWNLNTGGIIRILTGHSNTVSSIAFTPDGKNIVSGSYDKTIKLWDLSTGQLIRTFEGHSDKIEINSIVISSDGKIIFSGSYDKTIKLWNLRTGEVLRTLEGNSAEIRSLAISPDGHTLVNGILSDEQDNTIKIWRDN